MILQSTLRLGVICAAALVMGGLAAAQPRGPARVPSTTTTTAATVNGLIVQLRDAPSHVELARERAQARGVGATANVPASDRESARWQRLVADLQGDISLRREVPALTGIARRDPVGARAQVLRFAQPLTAAQADLVAARLATRPEVESITANTRERRQAITGSPPVDPYYPRLTGQWWLQNVQGVDTSPLDGRLRGVPDFLTAWTLSTSGSSSAVVAVLDTGITCHPDLGNITANCIGGAILPGYDFVSDDPVARLLYANDGDARDDDPRDPGDWVNADDRQKNPQAFADCEEEPSSWHGTVIAGMLAAQTNNGLGVAAMNWHGRVVPVRVAGKCGADVVDIIEGMRWAAGLPACKTSDVAGRCVEFAPPNPNPARIINISFGGTADCGTDYQRAINDVRAVGAVVVAAAGNGWNAPSRPASCQGVIGVGALNRDGFKTTYSNFGAALTISTIGGDDNDGTWGPTLADSGVLTIGNDGLTIPGSSAYFSHFGTSFSTPIASGAVSLMLSVNPALSVDQIIAGLKVSARPHVTFPTGVANLGLCSDTNPGRCQCTKPTCGAGMLDVTQALYYAANPVGYVNTRTVGDLIDTPELRAAAALGPDRPPNPSPPDSGGGGGGGGAMNPAWLLALLLAVLTLSGPLSATPPRPRRVRSPRRAPRH